MKRPPLNLLIDTLASRVSLSWDGCDGMDLELDPAAGHQQES